MPPNRRRFLRWSSGLQRQRLAELDKRIGIVADLPWSPPRFAGPSNCPTCHGEAPRTLLPYLPIPPARILVPGESSRQRVAQKKEQPRSRCLPRDQVGHARLENVSREGRFPSRGKEPRHFGHARNAESATRDSANFGHARRFRRRSTSVTPDLGLPKTGQRPYTSLNEARLVVDDRELRHLRPMRRGRDGSPGCLRTPPAVDLLHALRIRGRCRSRLPALAPIARVEGEGCC